MRFLVIDDALMSRRILTNSLHRAGYEDILEAEDGEEALQILRRYPVDFVITDWNMPRMNGLTLVQHIRQNEEWKDLPILMVTGRDTRQDVINAIKARVNGYIVKPFMPQELRKKIDTILHGQSGIENEE
ncbi:MAG: response regulator [Methanobacteriota archaeon]|nr:MAG: response regulator [Euryarchaeota archaeon]